MRVALSLTLGASLLFAASLRADDLTLIPKGVACDLGKKGTIVLGIPALDGRNAHAPVDPATVQINGKELTAKFGAPFEGVSCRLKILDGDAVEYSYENLPDDAKLVMCQFNVTPELIEEGLTATFDQKPPVTIPVQPGKTNNDARLASLNAHTVKLEWPSGPSLTLEAPFTCWFGVQDSRVWGKNFVGVCLTPPLKRDSGPSASFILTFVIGKS